MAAPSRTIRSRRGLSLMEVAVAIAVTSIAGAALLTSLTAAVRTSTLLAQRQCASGLATQLLDEITRLPVDANAAAAPLGNRNGYTAVDHFDGWTATPPLDAYGRQIGSEEAVQIDATAARPLALRADTELMAKLTRSASVERVQQNGAGGWETVSDSIDTPYRRVTVVVSITEGTNVPKPLATQSRIVSEVTSAP
ncbi:type IV pilus modification PilV family protein [Stratiformator vulcanicus]|uniref:Prepilin-type N-terminal cleavage/methylation domain-containing protein n=1 Tax=Stratiformator vulcanicus TaxID=2527980 RepID=A0A517R513_9PLAN|nr:hypothetical protein [Stratiformator vulcanicus]QDT38971.1 hypothetical protein Pan189_33710 [Stratiformator vulcanicus]